MFYQKKDMLEKTAAIKKFEYSPLDSYLKKKLTLQKNNIKYFNKREGDKTINKDDQKPTLKKYKKSDLIYDSKHSFHKYNNIKEFNILSFESKYNALF